MYCKLEITGTITVKTGMHIGASEGFAAIGAIDSPVAKDALSRLLYTTLANWYSSYIDCVFSLVYLIACLVAERDGHPRELVLRYAVTMALALGASAALFLPSALNLLAGAESGFGLKALINPKPIIMPLHLPAFFGIGAKVDMDEAIVPYLFTSALALVLAVFALVRPGLSRRRRLGLNNRKLLWQKRIINRIHIFKFLKL